MNTPRRTQKTKRNRNQNVSSSSEEIALLKDPKGVLELGCLLVLEMGEGAESDTLSIWMAHHLAELIEAEKITRTPQERSRAKRAIRDLVFRLWDHRVQLTGNAYPLKRFARALEVLESFHPAASPFRGRYGIDPTNRQYRLAGDLYDEFSRLFLYMLFGEALYESRPKKESRVAKAALSDVEKQVITTLSYWMSRANNDPFGILLDDQKDKRPDPERRLSFLAQRAHERLREIEKHMAGEDEGDD